MTKINKEKQADVLQRVLHELFDYNEVTGKWGNNTYIDDNHKKFGIDITEGLK